jgi:hypothetical protein
MTFNSIAIRHIYSGKNKLSFTMCYENMKETLPDLYYSYADISNPSWLTDDCSTAQSWDSMTQSLEPLKINDVNVPYRISSIQTTAKPRPRLHSSLEISFPLLVFTQLVLPYWNTSTVRLRNIFNNATAKLSAGLPL